MPMMFRIGTALNVNSLISRNTMTACFWARRLSALIQVAMFSAAHRIRSLMRKSTPDPTRASTGLWAALGFPKTEPPVQIPQRQAHKRDESEQERQANLEQLVDAHQKSGFRVLLNQSVELNHLPAADTAEGGSTKGERLPVFLAGVENWGEPPFKQYGDLDKALEGIPEKSFTILLSHDPSHWDAEVLGKTNVALTLSGHTHGMQFGIRPSACASL